MSRVALLAFALALLLAGCGGGNEQEKPPYTVDLSSPAGTADAWKYAVENHDDEVAAQLFLPTEKDTELLRFRDNVRASKARKITTRVTLDKNGQLIDDNTTVTWVTWVISENGVEKDPVRVPLVIVKHTDGTWRFSAAETNKAKAEYAAAQNAQNNPPPGNTPAPGNAPQPPANGE